MSFVSNQTSSIGQTAHQVHFYGRYVYEYLRYNYMVL